MAQQNKVAPDWERIEAEYQSILAGRPIHGVERDIVDLFRESVNRVMA